MQDDDSFLQDDGSVLSRGSPAVPPPNPKPLRQNAGNYQYQPQSMYQIPVPDGTQPKRLRNKQSFVSNGNVMLPPAPMPMPVQMPGPMLRPAPSFYMDPMQSQYMMMPPNQPYGMPQQMALPPQHMIIQSAPAPYGGASPFLDNRSLLAEQIEELEKYQRSRPRCSDHEDNSLLIATLVSEQDALYGTNMLENITPQDQEYITSLRQRGVPEHEALRMAFDRKPHAIKPPKAATRQVDSIADQKALEEAIQLSLTDSSRRASQPDRSVSLAAPSSDRADQEALEKAIQLSLQEANNNSYRYPFDQRHTGYDSAGATSSYLSSSAARASEQRYSRSHADHQAASSTAYPHPYPYDVPPQRPGSLRGGDDESVGSASYYSREGGDYHSPGRGAAPAFDRQYPYNMSRERPAEVLERPYHAPPPIDLHSAAVIPSRDSRHYGTDHRDSSSRHNEYEYSNSSSAGKYERTSSAAGVDRTNPRVHSARDVEELRARAYGKLGAPAAPQYSPPNSARSERLPPSYDAPYPYGEPPAHDRGGYPYPDARQPPRPYYDDDRSVSSGSRSSYSGDDRSVDRYPPYPYTHRQATENSAYPDPYPHQDGDTRPYPPTAGETYPYRGDLHHRAPAPYDAHPLPPIYDDEPYYPQEEPLSPDDARFAFQNSHGVSDLTNVDQQSNSDENTPRREMEPYYSDTQYTHSPENQRANYYPPGYGAQSASSAHYGAEERLRGEALVNTHTYTSSKSQSTNAHSVSGTVDYNTDYTSDYTSDYNSKVPSLPPPADTAATGTSRTAFQGRTMPPPTLTPASGGVAAIPGRGLELEPAPGPASFLKVQPMRQSQPTRGIAAASSDSADAPPPEFADESLADMPQHQWRKTLTRLVSKLTVDDDDYDDQP